MSTEFYWRLPTHGCHSSIRRHSIDRGDWSATDAHHIAPGLDAAGQSDGHSYIDHLAQIAKAAESVGFLGGLIPSFPNTDDPWVISPLLARETKAFRFMIAYQPGFGNPVHFARASASLQRATGGRSLFNIITGGGGHAQLWWGDSFDHDDRYGRTSEWLDVFRGVWQNEDFSYNGRFYQVENGGLPAHFRTEEFPDLWFSGSSEAALQVAARHADYYLSWLEPFDQLADKFARVKARTAALGGEQKVSVRVDLVARKTEEEAWADVRQGFENVAERTREQWRGNRGDSVGAARLASLKPTEARHWEDLIIAPNLWSGFSLLRGGPAIGIVGSYEQCAERLDDLIRLGANGFILAGTPHLEEAWRVGEEVLPLLGHQAGALLEAAE